MFYFSEQFAYTHGHVWSDLEFIYDFLDLPETQNGRMLNIRTAMYTRTSVICRKQIRLDFERDIEAYILTYLGPNRRADINSGMFEP